MGLHGFPNDDIEDLFGGSIFEMTYGGRDVVGYGFDSITKKRKAILSTNSAGTEDGIAAEGFHPIPGVTSISAKHQGPNLPIKVSITWKCYNTIQLEFLRQHFMMAGGYNVVEFGHIMSNRGNDSFPIFDFGRSFNIVNEELATFVIEGRGLMSDQLFEPAGGNYEMFIGQIVDHSIGYERDNTFTCTTQLVSIGEAIFGLHNDSLLGSLEMVEKNFTKTINDFFSTNARFDQMLSEEPRNEFVVKMRATNESEVRRTTDGDVDQAVVEAFKSTDGRFIPWQMFVEDVLSELFAVVNTDLSPPASLLLSAFNSGSEPAVGNHRFLSSTDPDTMVIVKPFMVEGNQTEKTSGFVDKEARFAQKSFVPNASLFFVSGSGESQEEKGLLSNGVWISVDAIKRSFTGNTNTFYGGMINLLNQMSIASANYWDLDLVYDEETSIYRIYDRNCVFGTRRVPSPYVFNRGTVGELLEGQFNATFSKEAKSAILYSSTRRTRQERQRSGDEMDEAGFNIPSTYTQALHIPELPDALERLVNEKRKAKFAKMNGGEPDDTRADDNPGGGEAVGDTKSQKAAFTNKEKIERTTDLARFADSMGPYIALSSEMISRIFGDGITNPEQINNLVAPIPTQINMMLTIQGIAGLAFFDTFLVDKLPEVYQKHGAFLIKGLQHDIDESGWTTSFEGLFYFVDSKGRGLPEDVAVGHQDDVPNIGSDRLTNSQIIKRDSAAVQRRSIGGIR